MAAGGFKEFVAGETLDEDEINDFLMQGMLVFADSTARASAITSPVEGQFSFLTSNDTVEFYDGSAWVELASGVGGAVVSSTTGSPTVTSGTVIGGITYDIYTFNGDGSIIFSDAGLIDLLAVAGGGGSTGHGRPAGGGGGGFRNFTDFYVAAGTATVTIGAGGVAGVNAAGFAGNGGETSFGSYPLECGGGGGGYARSATNAGNRTWGGGGGGGGQNVSNVNGITGAFGSGAGFDLSSGSEPTNVVAGLASSITGTSVTYAEGGDDNGAAAGSANTGDGAGGVNGATGVAGGSGRLIVRVAV